VPGLVAAGLQTTCWCGARMLPSWQCQLLHMHTEHDAYCRLADNCQPHHRERRLHVVCRHTARIQPLHKVWADAADANMLHAC
jgi:hypothetical protein